MTPEIHARLTIRGAFDPAEVTRRLGVEPSFALRKGDAWSPHTPNRIARMSVWESPWSTGNPLSGESYLESLLAVYGPKRALLQTLREEFGVELEVSVAVYLYDDQGVFETPSMHLDGDLIRKVHEWGAEVDLDLYVMPAGGKTEEDLP
jgi:hypothetical protein